MGRPSQTPIWPFLVVVSLLFLLCLSAPWEWEWLNRQDSAQRSNSATRRAVLAGPRPAPADLVSDADATICLPDDFPADDARFDAAHVEELRVESPAISTNEPEVRAQQNRAGAGSAAAPEVERKKSTGPELSGASAAQRETPQTEARPAIEAPAVSTPGESRLAQTNSPEASSTSTPEADAGQGSDAPRPPAVLPTGPRWPLPTELLRRLDDLACECACSEWALRAGGLVFELTNNTDPGDEQAGQLILDLRALAAEVDALLPKIEQRAVSIEVLRVRHALLRRLDVWALIPELANLQDQTFAPSKIEIDRLAKALNGVEALTRLGGAEGEQWHEYLAIDSLRKIASNAEDIDEEQARRVAGEVLDRLARADLTSWQRRFVTSGPVAQLAKALRPWDREPFNAVQLLADIERFESSMQASDARLVAEQAADADGALGDLAERLEVNYRNANVRVVLSDKLVRRLLPAVQTTTDTVRDQVLGLPTRGVSTTETKVDVKLVPNEHRLRFALEATGKIFANTQSTATAVIVHTRSDSTFMARKLLDFDLHGIRAWPAESDCLEASTRLRGIDTDLDGVPLAEQWLKSFARSKHAESQAEVRNLLRHKVETQARQKMDAATDERIAAVNQQLQERLMAPLDRLALDPQVISAETTEDRLTMRLRLAGDEQLAGHTPRPRAPGDSLASLQIHQSIFNNASEQLGLNGRTFTLPELREHIIEMLNLKNSPFMNSVDKDVSVTFAEHDAILVRCENGRMELNLAVAKLSNSTNSWKNFVVRVYYQPQVEGLSARLVRDGTVQLIGPRLTTRAQIALRGIFSKAFARDRELLLVSPKWSVDERTKDLFFSQFVIQDGWVAVAISEPKQNLARRPATAR